MAVPSVLMLQLDAGDPPGRLTDWLEAAHVEVERATLHTGATVPELGDHAGLIVLGGGMEAGDDAGFSFLPGVRALLRAAVEAQLPTLAVCLGSQLLATAHGGRVVPNPDGPELGAQLVAKRTTAATDPLFGDLPITPDVIQWHYDMISTLPAGAVLLASSPVCEHQAFRLGRLAWGIQFHIETTPDTVHTWAASDRERLRGFDLESILRRSDAVHDDIEQVWRPFVEAFAGVVRDPSSVPEARTTPSSVAAPLTDPAAIRAALAAEANAARGILPMPTLRPRHDG